ncbi:MAG: GNAT family N-acetyltransferase, partial [Acidobacteriaceae bacterium]
MTESLWSQYRAVLPFRNKRSDKPIRIRPAAREDLDALFALDQRCFRPGIAYTKTELRYFLFHLRSVSVVAEDAEAIAGFAIVDFQLERGERIGHIVTIDVAPEQRRCGVGRLLMDALLGFCRETRAESLRLEVAVDNDAALAFYKTLGFVETGRIRGFYMG